jgi:hypothetical protein
MPVLGVTVADAAAAVAMIVAMMASVAAAGLVVGFILMSWRH